MNAEIVKEKLHQAPFRSLAIETVGGTWIDVDREEDVLFYDRVQPIRVTIFSSSGQMYILGPEQIATIESR